MSSFSVKLCFTMMMIVLGLMLLPQSEAGLSDCYATWSRCSQWSNYFTGVVWLTCQDYCYDCKGREAGDCVEVQSSCPFSDKAWQCQCFGGYHGNPKPDYCKNWWI